MADVVKRRAAILALTIVAALGLTACSTDPSGGNTDPRKGRVSLTWSNCATGSCIYDWKMCVGHDLLTHVDDGGDYWTRPSAECQP